MKVLLTGRDGQLGQALIASCPEGIDLIATGRQELDLSDPSACHAAVNLFKPDWVINAGAYTAVDKAESEPELARLVNEAAPAALADALAVTSGRLLQLSTDFVFNGTQGHPYQPEQICDPIGVYGVTKAAGEQAVVNRLSLAEGGQAAILRTSWVYGPVGRNFLLTMLRMHCRYSASGQPLRVVADQVGCPTATPGLAFACWSLIRHQASGYYHWSDAGVASWYDFAVAIGEYAQNYGLISQSANVQPIVTSQYPTLAQRPAYSLLACAKTCERFGLSPQNWRHALENVISRMDA